MRPAARCHPRTGRFRPYRFEMNAAKSLRRISRRRPSFRLGNCPLATRALTLPCEIARAPAASCMSRSLSTPAVPFGTVVPAALVSLVVPVAVAVAVFFGILAAFLRRLPPLSPGNFTTFWGLMPFAILVVIMYTRW